MNTLKKKSAPAAVTTEAQEAKAPTQVNCTPSAAWPSSDTYEVGGKSYPVVRHIKNPDTGKIDVPLLDMAMSKSLLNTVEGGVLNNSLPWALYSVVMRKYRGLDAAIQNVMIYSAKPGEYPGRAAWWKKFLQECLNPIEAASAMMDILRWYRRCLIGHKTGVWHDGRLKW